MLAVHPSPDLYGSDRQLLETVNGLVSDGWHVDVCLPGGGPLVPLLEEHGASVHFATFPVLRRALLSPLRLARVGFRVPIDLWRAVRLIRRARPDVLYVNTLTIPGWIIAGRLCRISVLTHVHEAEEDAAKPLRLALAFPLLFASSVIANSQASRRALLGAVPRLAAKIRVIYNGVPSPDEPLGQPAPGHVVLVGRLSPRKGIDVAVDAIGLLRSQGRAVELDVCGTPFPGYEWYERELLERGRQPDVAGAVHFRGYVNPTWPLLGAAQIVLVPSRVEPFGNTAVEGLRAQRPVIASGVQGLAEVVEDGRTGLLVPPEDAAALAGAIAKCLDYPAWAARIAEVGREDALERFSVARYRADIGRALAGLASGPRE